MSAIDVRISTNSDLAAEFVRAFGDRAKVGIRRSLRRALAGIGKDSFAEARKEYPSISARDVKKSLTSRIWGDPPIGQASFSGRVVPLIGFSPRPSRVTRRRPPAGVSVLVKAQRKVIGGSFIASVRAGKTKFHVGVFVRQGAARLPIRQLFGPSIPQMLANPAVSEQIQERAAERFEKALRHEIDYAASQNRQVR